MKKSSHEIVRRTCGRDTGTNTTDRINGYDGNDTLYGMGGNDTLDGGAGADTFVFKIGAGRDVIEGADYRDGIVFGAGIAQSGLVASHTVDGLLLSYGTGDAVLIRGDSYPDQLRFADGSVIPTSQLLTVQSGATGYAVDGSAASEILIDTHYWATSFAGGAGNDSMPLAA